MDMCLPIEISVLLLVTLVHRCVETCNEGQFALQDSTCCPLCVKGWYVNQNCTKTSGVSCLPCKCENGSRMIANCTWFSNTECENVNISPNDVPKIYNLYAVAATTVTVLLVVGVWRWCITHKSEEHPATTRKKTATAATGGGPPVAVLTPAEDLALEQNSGRPIIVGIEGGTSSDPVCPHDTQPYVKVASSGKCHARCDEKDGAQVHSCKTDGLFILYLYTKDSADSARITLACRNMNDSDKDEHGTLRECTLNRQTT
ncbi:uncharacterized protein LOC143478449 isoform X1 [Brachyhypopomus gauderio]|uniref:uncharacterized protein LOC143478449 isoform X1 n=1 Tax=Brachyhypopomus gauderio TaxID=698409 RepID=UPI00404312BC